MRISFRCTWSVAGVLALTAVVLVLPAVASAADFVLTASHWGNKQDAAVAAAGGTLIWSHGKAGIASVTSDDPDFLARVSANKAFKSAAEDTMVQWQDPDFGGQSITPGDETFFPLQWNMTAIEAPAAWNAGCTGFGVRVAINDGGIDPTHPDLAPNMDTSCSSVVRAGICPIDFDTGGRSGTACTWPASSPPRTTVIGVIGVAPEATLVSVKVLHGGSGSFGWIIGGILYAADPAAFGRPDCDQGGHHQHEPRRHVLQGRPCAPASAVAGGSLDRGPWPRR